MINVPDRSRVKKNKINLFTLKHGRRSRMSCESSDRAVTVFWPLNYYLDICCSPPPDITSRVDVTLSISRFSRFRSTIYDIDCFLRTVRRTAIKRDFYFCSLRRKFNRVNATRSSPPPARHRTLLLLSWLYEDGKIPTRLPHTILRIVQRHAYRIRSCTIDRFRGRRDRFAVAH